MQWGRWRLDWGRQTHVMAIVNATPDSFSGDGHHLDIDAAVAAAELAAADGAAIVDVGGESTRPGHSPVSLEEELRRVVPVVTRLAATLPVPISIDTSKAEVAEAALRAGAAMVNDVRGLTADPELAAVVAEANVPVVIMHDISPEPNADLLASIQRELARRIEKAVAAGVRTERIIVDPGFGFGKDWRQNLELLRRLGELRILGRPILTGLSRKRTIGHVLDLPPEERLEGTLATTVLAISAGADIVRVHDVRANVRAARMADAVVRRVDAP